MVLANPARIRTGFQMVQTGFEVLPGRADEPGSPAGCQVPRGLSVFWTSSLTGLPGASCMRDTTLQRSLLLQHMRSNRSEMFCDHHLCHVSHVTWQARGARPRSLYSS